MTPTIIFKCKPSYESHQFEDRLINVDPNGSPCRVGRSQGQLKPKAENAIFECRVLSRNHAHIWYENDVFVLKDNGSSNGTFINQLKVGIDPVVIKTGDILQFGVDVDNNPHQTYWCVIAQVLCNEPNYNFTEVDWDPLNKYVKASSQSANNNVSQNTTQRNSRQDQQIDDSVRFEQAHDTVQSQFMQSLMLEVSALQQNVEGKFATVQRVISEIYIMQKDQWNKSMNTDILLTRIENLERRLQATNLPNSLVTYRRLLDEKCDLEMTSKMTLRKSLQEKLEIQNMYDSLKKSLNQSEEENENLAEIVQKLEEEEQKLNGIIELKDYELLGAQNELQKTHQLFSEEKSKFNLENCLNFVTTEKVNGRLGVSDYEALRAITHCRDTILDTTSEFVIHEAAAKNDYASEIRLKTERIICLENIIKSQASELACFFASVPQDLKLTQFNQISDYLRDVSDKVKKEDQTEYLTNEVKLLTQALNDAKKQNAELQWEKEQHGEWELERANLVQTADNLMIEKESLLSIINFNTEERENMFNKCSLKNGKFFAALAALVIVIFAIVIQCYKIS